MQRALLVAHRIDAYTHRAGAAEPLAWDSVKTQPGAAMGVAFVVLMRTRATAPLRLPEKTP
jgi:hypothetical protein